MLTLCAVSIRVLQRFVGNVPLLRAGGTKADEVKATLCALDGMPTLLAKLSLDSFTQDVLRAGMAVPGDADPIPPVLSKGNVGVAGDGKRARVSSVMLCLPR